VRFRFFALAFVLACCFSTAATAQPLERGALRLEWIAPAGCPDGTEIVERIEALLAARVADLAPEPIVARGTVRKFDEQRYELELETREGEQRFRRSMQAPSCAELSDAGALVLALAIDPKLAERRAQAAAASAPETPAKEAGAAAGATAAA
jgi:hypothetical protein